MEKVINGIKINYSVQGDGPLVVLLHGWGSNIKLFEGIFGLLESKYKVLALDMPGFGLSDEPPTPWNVDSYTDFVIDFIAGFDAREVILLGHSFGGRVIIKMSNRTSLPFSIKKIILVDSAGIKPKKSLKSKLSLILYKTGKAVFSIGLFKRIAPNAIDNMRKKRGSADYNSASEIMRQCLVMVVNEDLTPLLKGVTAPTLLIWGENDDATPLEDAKLMETLIPDSGLAVIKNAGHYSFLEQKYTFDKILSSFLDIKE